MATMPSPSRVYLPLPPKREEAWLGLALCISPLYSRGEISFSLRGRRREGERVSKSRWRYKHRYDARRNPFTHDRSRASLQGMKVCQERGTRCLACPPPPTVCSRGFVQATCFPFEREEITGGPSDYRCLEWWWVAGSRLLFRKLSWS